MRFTRTKAIVLAAAVALLSVALLVVASFALFSDSAKTTNRLEAGTLDVGLEKIAETSLVADEHGIVPAQPSTTEYAQPVDLTQEGAAVFSLGNCVPGIWQEVTLRVTNKGTVAFDYSVALVVTEEYAEGSPEANLTEQLRVTVTDAEGNEIVEPFSLAAAELRGDIAHGSLFEENAAGVFKIKVELPANEGVLDDGSNGTIMNAEVDFDITLKAVQKVETA